ncbi:MAG: FHA domain-containing protein [Theionarchaea archaeon]|nr:MAG: hypothetical protein AYK19_10570 [Theionarchaea archaeon DG-70-1]MBU7029369.1 FHA domain-containing protein [Theionarchaea archaeon]
MNEYIEKRKEPIRVLLLLCGIWFSYIALKDNALFGLIFQDQEMLRNKVLVTFVTTISTAAPTFFAVAMFKESFLVKTQAIYYYQRLIDRKIFWILAGLLAFFLGVISLSGIVLIPLLNFLAGIYLILFALNLSFRRKKAAKPVKPSTSHVRGPRILFRDQVFSLTKDFMTIGRGKKANIQIEDPKEVINPVHVGIKKDDQGQYWIIDNDSRNGTYIFSNGQYRKITKWALYNGDVFALCYNPSRGPYVTLQFRTD